MNDGTITSEKLIINGQEYLPEDASQLIELGSKYRQYEKDLNTSLDRVVPEYTKATQKAARVDQLEKDLKDRDTQLEELKRPKEVIPEDKLAIRKSAREAGLVDDDYLKEKGYMTEAEFDAKYTQRKANEKLVDNILSKASGLEKEIDGSDGRVPFDSDAVLAYASAYNIEDLTEAYDKMNTKGNAKWKEAQLAKEERAGLTTLNGGGKKEPVAKKITDDNFKDAWREQMGGIDE